MPQSQALLIHDLSPTHETKRWKDRMLGLAAHREVQNDRSQHAKASGGEQRQVKKRHDELRGGLGDFGRAPGRLRPPGASDQVAVRWMAAGPRPLRDAPAGRSRELGDAIRSAAIPAAEEVFIQRLVELHAGVDGDIVNIALGTFSLKLVTKVLQFAKILIAKALAVDLDYFFRFSDPQVPSIR